MLIANGIAEELGSPRQVLAQSAGALLERLTCGFIEHVFAAISHMRPRPMEILDVTDTGKHWGTPFWPSPGFSKALL